jgi:hypothetical protein
MLDLGYTRLVSLEREILAQIPEKVFVKTVSTQGFQGNVYTSQIYKIPSAGIGGLTFSPVVLEEEHQSLQTEAAVIKDRDGFVADGKLGWRLFNDSLLFLDLKNGKIAVSDSVRTFEERWGSLKSFAKVPFSLEKELIEFLITTPRGPLYCVLDSGCTLNHLQMKNRQDLSAQEILSDESRIVNFDHVRIGNKEFGAIAFRPLPIALPIRVQAVLGMDFLLNTQVLIDFKNRYIYFRSPF